MGVNRFEGRVLTRLQIHVVSYCFSIPNMSEEDSAGFKLLRSSHSVMDV